MRQLLFKFPRNIFEKKEHIKMRPSVVNSSLSALFVYKYCKTQFVNER